MDRRYTLLNEADDTASLARQGLSAEVDDLRVALATIRTVRGATGQGFGRLTLAGFSRGALLAYLYVGEETRWPTAQRHVDALVPMDMYARLSPDDAQLRAGACARATQENEQLLAGEVASDNRFFSELGRRAADTPDEPSPLIPPLTNRAAFLSVVGQTYQVFEPAPSYHLAAPILDNSQENVIGVAISPEARLTSWFAAAPPWQSLREIAESDAVWCGQAVPIVDRLADIRLSILYVGAAGGFGEYGRHTLEVTASGDIRIVMAARGTERSIETGHADLLFGVDAIADVFRPVLDFVQKEHAAD